MYLTALSPASADQLDFFAIIPLAMEGEWRVIRDDETFDHNRPETMEFADGQVTHSWFQEDDADCFSNLVDRGSYCVEGGNLMIEMDIDDDVSDRIVGAAPVSPNALHCTRYVREDGEVSETRFSLIREGTA